MPTPTEVIEKLFSTPNPDSGSLPPPEIAWAVFEHGTAFFAVPDDDLTGTASLEEVAAAARAALRELGPVFPGTSAADFSVSRLTGWYPDDPVWFVTFDSPTLAVVLVEELDHDLQAGMVGRGIRDQDHEAMRLVAVRNFRGDRS